MDHMDSARYKELYTNSEAMVEQLASELHQRDRSIEVLEARCAALMGFAETSTGTGEKQGHPAPSTFPIGTLEQLEEFEANAGASETFRQRVLEEMKEAYRFKMGMLFAPELLIHFISFT
ncbi:uncharacterized protein LOC126570286 [Anopheles aquasalis]|uniref:uncharacterized protein LOC126570286 n=1 Tax=Anopheles aquasalis TaxID=42839 RepID=UPI00215B5822|nr:uncharacterized protein LOC126570286 [Anopheles aquasalis]